MKKWGKIKFERLINAFNYFMINKLFSNGLMMGRWWMRITLIPTSQFLSSASQHIHCLMFRVIFFCVIDDVFPYFIFHKYMSKKIWSDIKTAANLVVNR